MPDVLARLGTGKVAVLCAAGLLFLAMIVIVSPVLPVRDSLAGLNDFAQLYVGAVLSGSPEIYSTDANLRVQKEILGVQSPTVVYMRLPFYAYLWKPVTVLPYFTAYLIFQCVNLCAILIWIALFARGTPEVAVLASVCMPIAAALALGQDIGIVALAYAGFFLLSERGRGFLAGLALSLCLIKPHFFPLTALALVLRREWPVVRGAVAGCSTLLALSFVAAGAQWPSAYLRTLRDPQQDVARTIMPNLHGMATALGWRGAAEGFLMTGVVAAFVFVVLRGSGRPLTFALALVGGLLLSMHAYMADAMLVLLAFGILGRAAGEFRMLLIAALTPVPYALLMSRSKLSITLVCLLLAAIASAVIAAWRPTLERQTLAEPLPAE